ncbi:hypothetical protein [Candidatus Methylocalor cossyra]|uniref:Glycosyltransferase RgtA/B/C/D-like domain-containing protein n=1 Tax=Candidatus Methylocalor cossyra TaxID=3108543 RepID=A0ABM9NJK5_9GAMM
MSVPPTERVPHFPLLLLLSTLALLPLLLADIPPLVDYLNHIARDYILAHYRESEILPKYYRPDWAFLPNLAMDLVIVPMAELIPIDLAGKLFLAATLLLNVAGVFLLSRTLHGRIELPAYLVFFFLYHRLLLWGYLNFSFGLGLALLGFALWLRLRARPVTLRLAVFGALATVLLLCHLFAFAVYVLFVGGYQLGATFSEWRHGAFWRDRREWLLIIGQVAIPLLLFLTLSPTTDNAGAIRYGTFLQKLTSAFHVVNNYSRPLDYATFFALLGLIALGWWKRWLELARPVLWPLALGALVQLAMPETLFGSQTADSRLPIALWMLLAAGLKLKAAPRPLARPLLLGLLTLALARLLVVGVEWRRANSTYREYLSAFDKITPGARMLSVIPLPRHPSFHHPPVNFIGCQAIIRKSVFDPFLFADHGHQPIRFTEPYLELAKVTPGPVIYYDQSALTKGRKLKPEENPFRPEILHNYDYLLVLDEPLLPDFQHQGVRPIHTGNRFVLYQIEH